MEDRGEEFSLSLLQKLWYWMESFGQMGKAVWAIPAIHPTVGVGVLEAAFTFAPIHFMDQVTLLYMVGKGASIIVIVSTGKIMRLGVEEVE